jgi:hypothetical protein
VEKWKIAKAQKRSGTEKEEKENGEQTMKSNESFANKKLRLTNDRIEKIIVAPRNGNPQRELTLASITEVFHLRQEDAARKLRVSLSVLKSSCKKFGVSKWPRRSLEDIMCDPIGKTRAENLP